MTTGLTIAMTTWAPDDLDGERRALDAQATMQSWMRFIEFDGPIRLHIADDGSALPGYPEILRSLAGSHPRGRRWEVAISKGERRGVGASLNRAFYHGFLRGDVVGMFVDDWALVGKIDLNPWVQLLEEREDVGMVRLGPPHPGVSGTIEALTGNWQGWGLRLDRHHYAFGHRPALYHSRMAKAYGWFMEGVNAYDCERLYAERYNAIAGPDVVLALPHLWQHADGPEFAGIVPQKSNEESS